MYTDDVPNSSLIILIFVNNLLKSFSPLKSAKFCSFGAEVAIFEIYVVEYANARVRTP